MESSCRIPYPFRVGRRSFATKAYEDTVKHISSARTQIEGVLNGRSSVSDRVAMAMAELFEGDERLYCLTSRKKPDSVNRIGKVSEKNYGISLSNLIYFKLNKIRDAYFSGSFEEKVAILGGLEKVINGLRDNH